MTQEKILPARSQETASPVSRWIAVAVLIPTVPMLLVSVASLALFYAAPGRFGALLARLPGEEFLRAVLIFSPATLFAIVVLALLYALEKPDQKVARPDPATSIGLRRASSSRAAIWLLILMVPALLASSGVLLLSLVAPGRYAKYIALLPGESYLRLAVRVAPPVIFTIVLLLVLVLLIEKYREPSERQARQRSLLRIAVAALLIPVLPMLLLSTAALGAFYFSPGRFTLLMERLTQATFLRLSVLFAPLVLFMIVLLILLYLFTASRQGSAERSPDISQFELAAPGVGQTVGTWVLVGGLILSAALGASLLSVMLVVLVLR